MWNDSNIDNIIEKELKNNPELVALFEEHPEKKEEYRKKLLDSGGGGGMKASDSCQCATCRFAETIKPIGKQPQTKYCGIYGRGDSEGKPEDVLYHGANCEYYEKG